MLHFKRATFTTTSNFPALFYIVLQFLYILLHLLHNVTLEPLQPLQKLC